MGIHDHRYRHMIERLIQARKDQKLSQATVAGRLNKPQQFVSRYEVGDRRLDVVEFLDVANALGLDGLVIAADGMRQPTD
jgi:transcriptional regulator with XRE-family HTH domain